MTGSLSITKSTFLVVCLLASAAYSQDCRESAINTAHKVLATITAKPTKEELELRFTARVDADWSVAGKEAAVLSVYVDGKYRQDMILFAGNTDFEYRSPIGIFDEGKPSKIELVFNKELSSENVGEPAIKSAQIAPLSESTVTPDVKYAPAIRDLARKFSPFIYARPETVGRFSDIPLLTYYEVIDGPDGAKTVRYTTVFTNEDGGTNSQGLLARWGRLADIEYVYEVTLSADGSIKSEKIQGVNHKVQDFKGKRIGSHPLILDAADNNNFADSGCSKLLLSPRLVAANLTGRPRESVMDAFPWTHRIMAEEAVREGRIVTDNFGPNAVDDPRNYFYVDLVTDFKDGALLVEVTASNKRVSSSDHNFKNLRVDRSGVVRIAVRNPYPDDQWPTEARVVCYSKSAEISGMCTVKPLGMMRLDADYKPVKAPVITKERYLVSGESVVIYAPPRKGSVKR